MSETDIRTAHPRPGARARAKAFMLSAIAVLQHGHEAAAIFPEQQDEIADLIIRLKAVRDRMTETTPANGITE